MKSSNVSCSKSFELRMPSLFVHTIRYIEIRSLRFHRSDRDFTVSHGYSRLFLVNASFDLNCFTSDFVLLELFVISFKENENTDRRICKRRYPSSNWIFRDPGSFFRGISSVYSNHLSISASCLGNALLKPIEAKARTTERSSSTCFPTILRPRFLATVYENVQW